MQKTIIAAVVLVVVLAGIGLLIGRSVSAPVSESNSVSYACDAGKTIAATFTAGESKAASSADQPPTPGGSVALSLSDGRQMTLRQTLSADGARYSDGDPNVSGNESFVFWSKGNGALVLEDNEQKSYTGCVVTAPDSGGLPNVYQDGATAFSIRYPEGYTPGPNYTYDALGPGKGISGVKFTIPSSLAQGTNLGSDSYISVESIPQTQSCSANLFLDNAPQTASVTDNGTDYSLASTTGAGAGNRYEETVYAIPSTNPCIAVRYFVHYSVIENYPPGTVQAFDASKLKSQLDSIRRTLVVSQ